MTKNSDYYFGGSLPLESETYVKRQADDLLFQNLLDAKFSYVLNSRQMGKSSLMLRTKQRLEKEGVGCVAIDLTTIGNQNITVTQWYRGVVKQIVDGLELEINWKKWWKEKQDEGISTVQNFGDFLREALLPEVANNGGHAVIFIDEIDSIINLPFGVDDFFAFIRACHNKRAESPLYNCLTFCLLGAATPSDLIADKTRTPFNIGTAIELTGFTVQEANDALTRGFAGKFNDPEAVLKEVLYFTGGQPFLTQKLCNLIVNYAESSNPNIRQLVEAHIINNWEEQDNPEHLRTIRDRILRSEQNTCGLFGLYRRVLNSEVAADASPEQMKLRLSGLVVKKNCCLQVYNQIYREIFNEDWIETELDKLRPYSEAINAWLKSERQDTSCLLRGEALKEALEWWKQRNFSVEDNAFLSDSQELDRQEQLRKSAKSFIKKTKKIFSLERASEDALKQFNSNQIKALLSAMKVGEYLQEIMQVLGEEDSTTSPIFALQQILAKIKERNSYPHTTSVTRVSFSPDGKMLATASVDGTARLWDLEGNQIVKLVGHTDSVTSVSFSSDGKLLATASVDGTARLWDLEGKLLTELVGHKDSVTSVSFSSDGKMLATASVDGTARLWDIEDKLMMVEFVGHTDLVTSVSFSSDGKMLATASSDQTARLWDIEGSLLTELVGHSDQVWSVSFSPDGKLLATGSFDGTARLWNLNGNLLTEFSGHRDEVRDVSFSPDGRLLATASLDGSVRLWDLEGKQIAELVEYKDSVTSVSWSQDGRFLATASLHDTARLWDLSDNQMPKFVGHTKSVTSVSLSQDGKFLATASDDGTARLWDLSGNQIAEFVGHTQSVTSVSWSQESAILATGSFDGTARLWDLSGNQIAEFIGHTGQVTSVSFSFDGTKLATASHDRTVRLWNLSGNQIAELVGHTDLVTSVSFSLDGKLLATASYDGTARLWDLSGKQIAEFVGHTNWVNSVSWSPDGKLLATASSDKTARLWNLSGNQIAEFVGHTNWVNSVSWSPDGKLLATASSDKTARLWNLSGNQIAEFAGHTNSVNSVSFSPDGKLLATASSDNTARLWLVENLEELLGRGCEWLKGYFVNHREALEELEVCRQLTTND